MADITLKGNPVKTSGELPKVGSQVPQFELVNTALEAKKLEDYKGQRLLLNIFPSIDTGVCAASTRKFNEEASKLDNTKVLCISNDLPFALGRFCAAEGIENVESLSGFRSNFGQDYGVTMTDSPLKGLMSRAVITLDEQGKVLYTEQVSDITSEPNYEQALQSLQ